MQQSVPRQLNAGLKQDINKSKENKMTGIDVNPYNNQNSTLSNIGSPIFCFTKSECVLKKNEIWLEGALAKILTYPLLFKEYGYDYTPDDMEEPPEGYFYLPDWRNRTPWGSPDGTFGYLKPTLPNITGNYNDNYGGRNVSYTGAFSGSSKNYNWSPNSGQYTNGNINFNAHNSDPIYQDGATVRTPSIKCRVKTRYQ